MTHDLFIADLENTQMFLGRAAQALRAAAYNRAEITEADQVFIDKLRKLCRNIEEELDKLK